MATVEETIVNAELAAAGERVGGYTIDELQAAFNRVRDARDWKAPIRATVGARAKHGGIDVALLAKIAAAVEFYTATKPTITIIGTTAHVTAVGYRQGPAGP
jgi:hypothetical protein